MRKPNEPPLSNCTANIGIWPQLCNKCVCAPPLALPIKFNFYLYLILFNIFYPTPFAPRRV